MSARRPLIAVNTDVLPPDEHVRHRRVYVNETYVHAILEAGGLPLLVPPKKELVPEYFERADGVLFIGGPDYPPQLYGEEPHPEVYLQEPARTSADLELMRLTRGSRKPALGICAGLQLLNISSGGALVQHLDTVELHRAHDRDLTHQVRVEPGTRLARIFGERLEVNSAHHQAVDPKRVGGGLRVTARADDGTVEGLELAEDGGRFFLFVQWHPERIADGPHRRKLFEAFIGACRP